MYDALLYRSRALQQTFRIGEAYHVEPSLNRVTGPSGITRLEPKVMLVLVCLAERAGQMVPKDRLLAIRPGPTPPSATMSSPARSPNCAGCSRTTRSSRASSRRYRNPATA